MSPLIDIYVRWSNVRLAVDWWASKDGWDKYARAAQEIRLARELRLRLCRRLDFFLCVGYSLLSRYLEEHPELRTYGLNTADLALTPEVRGIMHRPDDIPVDTNSFAALEQSLDAIIDAWRSRARSKLGELMRGMKCRKGVDPLSLATTLFSCARCSQTCLHFPAVLTHKCQRPEFIEWNQDVWADIIRRRNGLHGRLGNPDIGFALSIALWPCEHSESAHQIVRLCGMNPWGATVGEMDALNVRLVQGDVTMTWRAAVSGAVAHSLHMSALIVPRESDHRTDSTQPSSIELAGGWS